MAKIFTYKGKTIEEMQKMCLEDFAKLLPSRQRRSLMRGIPPKQRCFLARTRRTSKPLKTHLRDMIIIPEFVGKQFMVHNGKEWIKVDVRAEMVGHRLGEYSRTTKYVTHSAPGVGATRSSKFLPLK